MTGLERIRYCLKALSVAPLWMLECAKSDANYYGLYAEESTIREEISRRYRQDALLHPTPFEVMSR